MSGTSSSAFVTRFDSATNTREFANGRFDAVEVGSLVIGRATYGPGWKWSEHVGPVVGKQLCEVEHAGLVLSGAMMVAFDDGTTLAMEAGDLFYIPPVPHDAWVVGEEPYVSLHFVGAEQYATAQPHRERSDVE